MKFVKRKLKVGDIVKIKSEDWYNENNRNLKNEICLSPVFVIDMVQNCGKKFVIESVVDLGVDDIIRYTLKGDPTNCYYRAEYFE